MVAACQGPGEAGGAGREAEVRGVRVACSRDHREVMIDMVFSTPLPGSRVLARGGMPEPCSAYCRGGFHQSLSAVGADGSVKEAGLCPPSKKVASGVAGSAAGAVMPARARGRPIAGAVDGPIPAAARGRPNAGLGSGPVTGVADQTLLRLGGRQPLWGSGVTSMISVTSMPAPWMVRMADSRPLPGPLT